MRPGYSPTRPSPVDAAPTISTTFPFSAEPNREIAQQLGIKENTVKKSLLRTYDKLGVSNRVELVLYALTHRGNQKAVPPVPKRPSASTPINLKCLDSDPAKGLVPEFDVALKN